MLFALVIYHPIVASVQHRRRAEDSTGKEKNRAPGSLDTLLEALGFGDDDGVEFFAVQPRQLSNSQPFLPAAGTVRPGGPGTADADTMIADGPRKGSPWFAAAPAPK